MKDKKDIKIKTEKKHSSPQKEDVNIPADANNTEADTAESVETTEIDKLKQEIENLKDSYLRKAAEFENYKKRSESEFVNYLKYSSEKIIRELIPVYDDFNRTVESLEKQETNDFETLKTAFLLVYDKFKKVLEKEGLKEIDCLGKEFDVNLNDALLMVPREDVKPNTVIEVVEKGYYLNDKVLRHSKVLVSAEPEKTTE
ncbi:MAG: nucleotide exchange factor GrpE [Ignavibacteria bacterium]|nr:nucleotide exchange factor GrpE [Ignavibacteria bacterium]